MARTLKDSLSLFLFAVRLPREDLRHRTSHAFWGVRGAPQSARFETCFILFETFLRTSQFMPNVQTLEPLDLLLYFDYSYVCCCTYPPPGCVQPANGGTSQLRPPLSSSQQQQLRGMDERGRLEVVCQIPHRGWTHLPYYEAICIPHCA